MKSFWNIALSLAFSISFFALCASADAATLGVPSNYTGLVGYWTFNGKDMAPNVRDISGLGNHGNLAGVTSTTTLQGVSGQALDLDGKLAYISLGNPASLSLDASYTISFWAKRSSEDTTGAIIRSASSLSNNSSNLTKYEIRYQNSDELRFTTADGVSTHSVDFGITNKDDQWTMIACTLANSATKTCYQDGQQLGTANDNVDTSLVTQAGVLIGAEKNDGASNAVYFDGALDEMRIYSRALSAAEVKQLYSMSSQKIGAKASSAGTLQSGLVAHYTFDGSDMASNVRDATGSGKNGTMSGFTSTSSAVVAGKLGQALRFQKGILNQRVNISAAASSIASGDLSVSAWIKPSSVTQDAEILHLGDNPSDNDIVLQWGNYGLGCGTGINFAVYSGSSLQCANASGFVTPEVDAWYHVVGTFSTAEGIKVYVDGISRGTNANKLRGGSAAATLVIGTDLFGTATSNAFNGTVDDVRIYNRALSASEVAQLYSMGGQQKIGAVASTTAGTLDSGLVGYWPFDGKYMTPNVRDISGQGNHGNLSGQTPTTTAPGRLGQALKFDGVNDYVSAGSEASLDDIQNQGGGGMSVAFWVKPDSNTTKVLLAKGTGSNNTGFWAISKFSNTNPARLTFQKEGSTDAAAACNSALNIGIWQHIVLVWNGSMTFSDGGVTLYKNGSVFLCSYTDGATLNSDASNDLTIGGEPIGATFADASLDDVRIYNRMLSANEAKQLYNMGR